MEVRHIGKLIKERVAGTPHLTIKAFAERLNVHEQTIYDIYRRETVNTDLLQRICDILEVPITYFLAPNPTTYAEPVTVKDAIHFAEQPASLFTPPVSPSTPSTVSNAQHELSMARMKIELLEAQLRDKELIIQLLMDKLRLLSHD
jgi:transcriptional regulator with XRE-family HTH domain